MRCIPSPRRENPNMQEPLLIVGASARAAAEAAVRSGFRPFAIDQFGDIDLCRVATVRTCPRFPESIAQVAADLPDAPVLLAGGMENHPQIVAQLAASRPVYGCPPAVVRRVRDPLEVQRALVSAGLAGVETRRTAPRSPASPWLIKRLRGSGGLGIRLFEQTDASTGNENYYQEFIEGHSQSGLFLAHGGNSSLVAVTEQWIGTPWLNARTFGYAGSLGPLKLEWRLRAEWEAIGCALARHFSLRGLFGVDAVVQGDVIRPVEVNPRFTASAEIVDLACNTQIVRQHVRACRGESIENISLDEPHRHFAKAVYFAPEDLVFPHGLADFYFSDQLQSVEIRLADIPPPLTPIAKTHPVATLLARSTQREHLGANLHAAAERFASRLLKKTQDAAASSFSVIGDQRRPANCG
ncbi:MAG: ATP-grasp domain-containing protein [Planctomycetota bacterium]|nr:ATP-grasp domain-containing protein [Planctomycetota bacterium]